VLFWRERRPGVAISAIALAAIAGCTSTVAPTPSASPTSAATSTPTASVTPSASATPTWNPEQVAAIEVVGKFADADDKIGADPSAFTEKQMTNLLKEFSGGEALNGTVNWNLLLKKNGYRLSGEIVIVSTDATRPVDNGRGAEVHVTQCQDQRQGKIVDKGGNPVTADEFQIAEFNLRQFSVRKPPGEATFRVFGFQTINGKCP
jgi:hypothetical protein